ncbi:hypothetical protein BP6252_06441 [Coleophoma cylindrospora]|uniref:Aminotransferase class I/classII large domain-containing protein n=1 Tax=Coleophoma cylindrospora TaxID=1849047 RepID=A0A3D8RMM1_9HELO|nr:hypothetical protein BP6252_06441 [Coleophoma cylindrospora]
MASHINDYFSPHEPVQSEHITFTAGVTGLNEMISLSVTDEGQAILLGRPIYGSFYGDLVTKSKCELVYTSFPSTDQFSPACVEAYESAYLNALSEGVNVKAVIICNPHNPLGRCYSAEALKALLLFCSKYSLHLISDEIYALCTFEVEGATRTPFTSLLSIDLTGLIRKDFVHVLYGMSKDFGAAGLRLGCLITRNESLTAAIQAIGRFNWPSELSVSMATNILEDKAFVADYTRKSRLALGRNYAIATGLLDQAGIKYAEHGNAGFFIWMDLSPYLGNYKNDAEGWEAEKKLKELLENNGMTMPTGLAYKAERPGWYRILFTVEQDALEESFRSP